MEKLESDLENFVRLCHLHEKTHNLEQALAEKDRLIERLKQEAETHAQEARTVKQLMAQAVRFAVACVEHYVLHTSANAFLNSPEARAFLMEHLKRRT